jgi:hypothetical protein
VAAVLVTLPISQAVNLAVLQLEVLVLVKLPIFLEAVHPVVLPVVAQDHPVQLVKQPLTQEANLVHLVLIALLPFGLVPLLVPQELLGQVKLPHLGQVEVPVGLGFVRKLLHSLLRIQYLKHTQPT